MPLYLTINFCLLAFIAAGTLGIIQQNTHRQARERESLGASLDQLISRWNASDTPPQNRVLRLMIGGVPDDSPLVPPERRPFWHVLTSWLHKEQARREHARLADQLLGSDQPSADWYSQGQVWASERQARMQALTAYLAKARQAQARIMVVADARESDGALSAIEAAATPSSDLVLVERMVVMGAHSGMLRSGAAAGMDKPPAVGEWVSVWRTQGGSVSGVQLEIIARSGRSARLPLGKDEASTLFLLRRLVASDKSMEATLRESGDLPASAFPPDPPGKSLGEARLLPASEADAWEALFREGRKAHQEGRCDDAEALLERALAAAQSFGSEDPRLVRSLFGLANLKQGKESEPYYQQALKILGDSPKYDLSRVPIHYNLAGRYGKWGRHQEALAHYRAALTLHQRSKKKLANFEPSLHLAIGTLHLRMKQMREAESELLLALKTLKPGSEDKLKTAVLGGLARIYKGRSQSDSAERYFREAIALGEKTLGETSPQFISILESYAGLLEQTGRGEAAGKLRSSIADLRARQQKKKQTCPGSTIVGWGTTLE